MIKVSLYPLESGLGQREIAVRTPEFVLGRADDCDYQVHNPLVSRRHCALEIRNDELFVRDLESSNGTAINGTLIVGACRLRDGDLLWLANSSFEVHVRPLGMVGSGINLISRAVAKSLGFGTENAPAYHQAAVPDCPEA